MPKLLILDLDETLIHASGQSLQWPPSFRLGEFYVYCRPYLPEFVQFCRQHFSVAVWTSATVDYASAIVSHIFGPAYPLDFLWTRDQCTQVYNPEMHQFEWVKNLKKLKRRGFSLEQTLFVDDTPAMLARNYGNLVRVIPFEGNPQDNELHILITFLLDLKDVPNVRNVEKRNWRCRLNV